MKSFVVTGSENGLGKAIADALQAKGHRVWGYDERKGLDVRDPQVDHIAGPVDGLVNCAGINMIDWLEDLKEPIWDAVMDVNAKGMYLMTQALLGRLIESRGVVLNIVSNASHMPMTCSAAYNASKGAAAILTKQMARELTRKYGITVFSISPNKLSGTNMSREIDAQVCETRGWSMEQAREYQLASLLWGEETPAANVAELAAWLLHDRDRHKFLSGCDIPYGA